MLLRIGNIENKPPYGCFCQKYFLTLPEAYNSQTLFQFNVTTVNLKNLTSSIPERLKLRTLYNLIVFTGVAI